jgi:putative SOS response-associated peptidase YedK
MCGRYAATADTDRLAQEFEIDEVTEAPAGPNWNIAPTHAVPAIVERIDSAERERRKLVQLRWGLVPSWSKDASTGARMINARVETVAEKPAFRKAFVARRCLLPADGYFEWYAGTGKKKQPYFIHRGDGGLLVMAGIYEFWRNAAVAKGEPGAWISSCSIITTSATDELGRLHDRMPMVIQREAWDAWLDPRRTDPEEALALLQVTDAGQLTAHPVDPAVGNVRNNGPELIRPLDESGAAGDR